ncbi:MAG: polysaccharide biosynthesis protein [Bacillaceae bacterium]|nr:polysaccharide biosynthesis protein [Bacillaceae bacterium]
MSLNQETAHNFVKGAAILGIASLLSKIMGLLYRIPYQNITGDKGYYVYMQVYPLYSSLLILAMAGFPIAISKLVSEHLASGNVYGARRVFYVSSVVLALSGLVFFCILFFGASFIASLMGDPNLTLPIQSVSFALLIVPVMSVIRGYFQGHENMIPTAVSQVAEQFVRVATILVLAYWFMVHYQDVYLAGAGAVFGAVTGSFTALMILLFYWGRLQRTQKRMGVDISQGKSDQESIQSLLKRIFAYAIPICLAALVLPLFPLSDSFTVVNMLTVSGHVPDDARVLKGVYDRGQPLVQFASFFATALSLALVPSISAAKVNQQHQVIASRTALALRLTFLLGLAASVGLAVVAQPVNIMLYENDKGTLALMILAFSTIFSTLGITAAGILQGLGQMMLPVRYLFYGVIVKVILNILLIPLFGIQGAALATVASYAVSTSLSFRAIRRLTGMPFHVNQFFIKPVMAVMMMAISVYLVKNLSVALLDNVVQSVRLYYTSVSLISVFTGAVIYVTALLVTGALTRSDLRYIPKGERIIPILSRLRLLKD